MTARGLLVAAPRSGAGKTVVTIGLQRALRARGLRVAGVKTGPDYIDPAFHAAACGRPSLNLDGFAMPAAMICGLAAHAASEADVVIGEGAMGLYDGASSAPASASADIARLLGWPVVLVLDAEAAAQTLAAIAYGLARFPAAPTVAGAIVNRVASARHGRMIAAGFAKIDVPLFGLVPRAPEMALPSRHLGLVQAGETGDLDATLDAIGAVVAEQCDLDAILAAAAPVTPAPLVGGIAPPGQRIAVARDAAFGFVYPHLLEGWRRGGAEILPFSPLADEAPDTRADMCWLPGGYPELHAGQLSANTRFLDGLRRFTGPVHGECGGYMVLGRGIVDANGERHAMAGLLPVGTSFATRRLHLGYRRVTWRAAMPFARAGETHIGHEYHHATLTTPEGEAIADARDGEGGDLGAIGSRVGAVTGSFFHLVA